MILPLWTPACLACSSGGVLRAVLLGLVGACMLVCVCAPLLYVRAFTCPHMRTRTHTDVHARMLTCSCACPSVCDPKGISGSAHPHTHPHPPLLYFTCAFSLVCLRTLLVCTLHCLRAQAIASMCALRCCLCAAMFIICVHNNCICVTARAVMCTCTHLFVCA